MRDMHAVDTAAGSDGFTGQKAEREVVGGSLLRSEHLGQPALPGLADGVREAFGLPA